MKENTIATILRQNKPVPALIMPLHHLTQLSAFPFQCTHLINKKRQARGENPSFLQSGRQLPHKAPPKIQVRRSLFLNPLPHTSLDEGWLLPKNGSMYC